MADARSSAQSVRQGHGSSLPSSAASSVLGQRDASASEATEGADEQIERLVRARAAHDGGAFCGIPPDEAVTFLVSGDFAAFLQRVPATTRMRLAMAGKSGKDADVLRQIRELATSRASQGPLGAKPGKEASGEAQSKGGSPVEATNCAGQAADVAELARQVEMLQSELRGARQETKWLQSAQADSVVWMIDTRGWALAVLAVALVWAGCSGMWAALEWASAPGECGGVAPAGAGRPQGTHGAGWACVRLSVPLPWVVLDASTPASCLPLSWAGAQGGRAVCAGWMWATAPEVLVPRILAFVPAFAAALALTMGAWFPESLPARRVLVFYAAASLLLGLRWTRAEAAAMGEESDAAAALWDARQRGYARYAYKTIARVRGFFVKAGQYMSSRADVLPKAFVSELQRVQDEMPSTPFALVKQAVEADLASWGWRSGTTLAEVFEAFDETPIASASIAQVHKAVLRASSPASGPRGGAGNAGPGRMEVAVKVQHPGIEARMLQDASSLRAIVAVVAFFEPTYDFRPVLDEWCAESVKELRFDREGRITRRVRRALQRAGVDVEVPDVIDLRAWRMRQTAAGAAADALPLADAYDGGDADGDWVQSPVRGGRTGQAPADTLVMRFVNGFKLGDEEAMRAHGADVPEQRDALMRSVVEAFGVQQLLAGCFTGDPHPGNVLLEPVQGLDGAPRLRPVLLDFGLAKTLPSPMRVAFSRLVAAASDGDASHLLDAFEQIGVRLGRDNTSADMRLVGFLLRDVRPPAAARKEVMKHRERVRAERKLAAAQPRPPASAFPGVLLFFLRATEILHGVGSRLGSSLPYLQVMGGFARLALRAATAGVDLPAVLGVSVDPSASMGPGAMRSAVLAIAGASGADAVDPSDLPQQPQDDVPTLAHLARLLAPPPLGRPGAAPAAAEDAAAAASSYPKDTQKQRGMVGLGQSAGPALLSSLGGTASQAKGEGDAAGAARSTNPLSMPLPLCLVRATPFRGRLDARLHALLGELFRSGDIVGAQVAVYRRGRLIADVAGGEIGPHDARPVRSDSLFNVFSATKGLMAAVLHRRMDATQSAPSMPALAPSSQYDAAINTWWPEWGAVPPGGEEDPQVLRRLAWKRATTLRHLLTHQAGLAHAMPPGGASAEGMASLDTMEAFIGSADALPLHPPGAFSSYHYLNFGFAVGGVLRRLSGRDGPAARGAGLTPSLAVAELAAAVAAARLTGGLEAVPVGEELFVGLPDVLAHGGPRLATLSLAAVGRAGADIGAMASAMAGSGDGGGDGEEPFGEEDEVEAAAGTSRVPPPPAFFERAMTRDRNAMLAAIRSIKGREYLLDPRVFNRDALRRGQVPAANGHASARALGAVYSELLRDLGTDSSPSEAGEGRAGEPTVVLRPLVSTARLQAAVTPQPTPPGQPDGPTAGALFAASPSGDETGGSRPVSRWGLGFQLWPTGREGGHWAFGHAGIGGSIGLADPESGVAVAVTVNRLSFSLGPTKAFLRLVAEETGLSASIIA